MLGEFWLSPGHPVHSGALPSRLQCLPRLRVTRDVIPNRPLGGGPLRRALFSAQEKDVSVIKE